MPDEENIVTFKSSQPWLTKESISVPAPSQNYIPDWYKDADRFAKMPNGEYYKATKEVCPFPKEGTTDDYGKIPTWKACPAILDSFMTGYVLKTPCDIDFFKNEQGIIDVKVHDSRYKNFVTKRPPMAQFEHPMGFYKYHFAWYPDWEISLPEGYSAIYLTPMNRFDLPFLNTSGIIDNDKVSLAGTFPFFVSEGWEGTIPEGTPYMQFIPFKRENWSSEVEILNTSQIYTRMMDNAKFYRQPDGGIYKNKVWSRREYK
jgi:hypothetical protein